MRYLIYYFLLVLVLAGCKKEMPEEPQQLDEPPPTPVALDLMAGDTTGMTVLYYSDTVIPSSLGGSDYLNVDLDGEPGVEFTLMYRTYAPSMNFSPMTMIWFTVQDPDLHIIGYTTTDTILQSVDSTLTFVGGPMYPWHLDVDREVGCGLEGETSIVQVNDDIFRPHVYDEGSQMDTLAGLPVDSVLLLHSARSFSTLGSILNDSTLVEYDTDFYNGNCFGVPTQEIFYIGYILNGPNGPRHGFMRLEVNYGLIIHYAAVET